MLLGTRSDTIFVVKRTHPQSIKKGPEPEARVLKRAGDYIVAIQVDRNPPIMGVNNLEVEIRGADGAEVTDAKVLVNYYMPPMPRMAPMNYRVDAPFRNRKYRVAMNFIMEGPWYIVVKINHKGKAASAKFNVNVP